MRDAGDAEDFALRIKKEAESLPAGTWILGGNWDHEAWPVKDFPTKELIDKYTPKHPVFVNRLDGHVALSRKLAARNQYPAVDLLDSISRLMIDIMPQEAISLSAKVRELVSIYKEAEDLINIGAYVKGSNPKIDEAISKIDDIYQKV